MAVMALGVPNQAFHLRKQSPRLDKAGRDANITPDNSCGIVGEGFSVRLKICRETKQKENEP